MSITEGESSGSAFGKTLAVATQLPGVQIDRSAYLRRSLARHCTDEQVREAIDESPAAAGISSTVLDKIADASIRLEASRVTGLSAAAGLPGGFAMIGTIPADAAQYLAHMLRIAQKLAYLYSWPELFAQDSDGLDDETQNVLTLFVGVMFGVRAANNGLGLVAIKVAEQTARKLPQQALTKGVIYPIVKKVAGQLGAKMTKDIFAKGVAKAIPVAGAVLSGGLTLSTFLPMAKRLKKHLSSLETTTMGSEKPNA